VVREISHHSGDRVRAFMHRWRGRILFGSDIVTNEEHLQGGDKTTEMAAKASDHESAFDLYASRYWALRALWETDWSLESPISDPDLAMVDPGRHPHDAPRLEGKRLPTDTLRQLYREAALKIV
jgi:hypothetical protein